MACYTFHCFAFYQGNPLEMVKRVLGRQASNFHKSVISTPLLTFLTPIEHVYGILHIPLLCFYQGNPLEMVE